MSANCLKMLLGKVPKVSLKGLAYLASANFMARAIILLRHYVLTSFHSEMILIYGAHLDTRILLFFQGIYMLPMFLLGVLVFYGIDRESFNLVLYPTLMLVFLILIRYGSEAAILVIHFEDHKLDQTPALVFALIQDIIFIILLLLYIYFCLAFTPIKPTPLELIEGGGNTACASTSQGANLVPVPVQQFALQQPQPQGQAPSQLQAPPPQAQAQSPPLAQSQVPTAVVEPDSQGFNYSLRRNIDHSPKETAGDDRPPLLDEIDRQRQQTATLARDKESLSGCESGVGGGVIETDLDAVPTTSTTTTDSNNVESGASSAAETPTVTPTKLNKSRIAAARKKVADVEKEPEVDFWASMNGDGAVESTTKADGFKTTSV